MIAQLVSQFSSHFIIYYHRKSVRCATEAYENRKKKLKMVKTASTAGESGCDVGSGWNESDSRANKYDNEVKHKLCDYSFTGTHGGECKNLAVQKYMSTILILFSFALILGLICGTYYPTFENETYGIVGLLEEYGRNTDSAINNYSVWGIVNVLKAMGDVSGTEHAVGTATMAAVLVYTVLIIPIFETFVLCYLWFWPMTRNWRNTIVVLIETLQAWQYCEVYLLALILETWRQEMSTYLAWREECTDLDRIFGMIQKYGFGLEEVDAQCLQVETRVGIGGFLFFVVFILINFLESYIIGAALQYLRETDPMFREEEDLYEKDRNVLDSIENIKPAPFLFTDQYGWTLQSHDEKNVDKSNWTLQSHDEKNVDKSNRNEFVLSIDEEFAPSSISSESSTDKT